MSDLSNAWPPKDHPDDVAGQWEDKHAQAYPVDVYGSRYIVWRFPKVGSVIRPHKHLFEHSSILLQGTVMLTGEKEGRNGILVTAPDVLFFAAGVEHSFRAFTEDVLLLHTYPPGTFIEDES